MSADSPRCGSSDIPHPASTCKHATVCILSVTFRPSSHERYPASHVRPWPGRPRCVERRRQDLVAQLRPTASRAAWPLTRGGYGLGNWPAALGWYSAWSLSIFAMIHERTFSGAWSMHWSKADVRPWSRKCVKGPDRRSQGPSEHWCIANCEKPSEGFASELAREFPQAHLVDVELIVAGTTDDQAALTQLEHFDARQPSPCLRLFNRDRPRWP